MNKIRLRQTACSLPLYISLVSAVSALALVGTAALFAPHAGIPPSSPPFGNLLGVARTYLFRHAVSNTLLILAGVFMLVYLAARFAYVHHVDSDRTRSRDVIPAYVIAITITPLFLPVPTAAFLWQPLFAPIDILWQPRVGLGAILLVQTWRLWPLVFLVAPLARRIGANRTAIGAALLAVIAALIDAGTPLMLTAGEPYNETHLWAPWSLQAVRVSQYWAHGAVMYGGLAVATGVLGASVWLILLNPRGPAGQTPARKGGRLRGWAVGVGVGSALLPLAWSLPHLAVDSRRLSVEMILGSWVRWAAGSVIMLLAIALIAAGVAVSAWRAGARNRASLVAVSLVLGLAAIPAWDWLGMRELPSSGQWAGGLLVAIAVGLCAGLIALWPITVGAGMSGQSGYRAAAPSILIVTALFAGNQFALPLLAAERMDVWTLAAGSALQLANLSQGEAASLFALVTYATTYVLTTIAAYAFAGRRPPATATQP